MKAPRILMYHAFGDTVPEGMNPELCVRPCAFDNQLAVLKKKGYTFLTMTELIQQTTGERTSLPIPSSREHECPHAVKRVALTFDDGFADNAEIALPILHKHQAKATIFIAQKNDIPTARMLSDEQLRALAADQLIELGAHTLNHVNLTHVDAATAERELAGSKAYVESYTQQPCVSFAYPYGRFTEETVALVKRLGFRSAVTVKKGFAPLTDPYRIRRTGVLRSCGGLRFRILLLCGRYRI